MVCDTRITILLKVLKCYTMLQNKSWIKDLTGGNKSKENGIVRLGQGEDLEARENVLAFHLEKVHLFLINLHLYSHFPTICETMKNSCIRQIPCRLSGAQRIGRGIKWGTRWLYTYMGAFWAGGLQHPKVPHHSSPSSWQRQLSTGVTITSVDLWKTLANPARVWRELA